MDLAMAASLAALALIDSTSFGTLLIPIWLLLAPGRVRAGRMLVYLGTITVFYFAVGMAIVLGATAFTDDLGALLDTRPAMWAQLAVGVGLVVLSFRFDSKKSKEGGGRMTRWRERALGVESEPGAVKTRAGALPSWASPSARPPSKSPRCSRTSRPSASSPPPVSGPRPPPRRWPGTAWS
nr:hypothetical protein GCM10025732_25780 [Glycomyces mayteni]